MNELSSRSLLIVADYPFLRIGEEIYAEVSWDERFAALYRPVFGKILLLGRLRRAVVVPTGWIPVERRFYEVLDGGDWDGVGSFLANLPRLFRVVRSRWPEIAVVYLKLFYLNSLAVFWYNLLRFSNRKPVVTLLVGDAAEAVLLRKDLFRWLWARKLASRLVRAVIWAIQRRAGVPGYVARYLAVQYRDRRSQVVIAAEPWISDRHINLHRRERARRPAGILFVGRLIERKRPGQLLRAVAELAREGYEIRLVFVGEGPERPELERQAEKLGLGERVIFQGWLGLLSEEMLAQYDAADIFCLPSYAEGLPLVLLEAMARGVPVVATAVNGTPEVVRHEESGLLVPRDDLSALRAALKRLLTDAGLWRRCVDGGYRMVRQYTFEAQRGRLAEATKALVCA